MSDPGYRWGEMFGSYAYWRLPSFPAFGSEVPETAWTDEHLIEELTNRIIKFYGHQPIQLGYLFRRLRDVSSLSFLEFSRPLANLLLRYGIADVKQLSEMSTLDFLSLNNVGRGKFNDLIRSLTKVNLKLALTVESEDFSEALPEDVALLGLSGSELRKAVYNQALSKSPAETRELFIRLLDVSLATHLLGNHAGSVFKSGWQMPSPERDYLDESLKQIPLAPLVADLLSVTWKDLVSDFVNELDEREQIVLERRFLAQEESTLDEIGAELGLTRERIRQIAAKIQLRYSSKLNDDPIFRAGASAFRHLTWYPVSRTSLKSQCAGLFEKLENGFETPFQFFAKMNKMEINGDWIYRSHAEQINEFAQAWAEASAGAPCVTLEELHPKLVEVWPAFDKKQTAAWLNANGYLDYRKNYYLAEGASHVKVAKVILHVTGHPLDVASLFSQVPGATSLTSFRNRLLGDPELVRTGRDTVGLRVWGTEEFTTIAEALERLIRNNGSQSLDGTIRRFTEQFGVAESAIRAYANAYPLEVVNGQIRLSAVRYDRARIKQSRKNVYRTDDGWAWRMTVTAEHLRGSGGPCPAFLADQLELSFEKHTIFECEQGRLVFTASRLQRNLGSIREICTNLSLQAGDQLMLIFRGKLAEAFKISGDLTGETLVRALAALPDSGDLKHQLSKAFGESNPSSIEDLIRKATARRETDLVMALTALR